ncbi:MAG: GntR family transcriptional regulator [Christensenellaceae bacterium]|nr:GntR family transcriptional regulator [Christensenellaceae bacterium]
MNLIISNADGRPIYEQIAAQIRDSILAGELQPGDMLPSIRALAKDLRISVITTKRAYDELEAQGCVHTVAGKGCFVAEQNGNLLREAHLKEIEAHMQEILRLAAPCRLTVGELTDMLRLLEEESRP